MDIEQERKRFEAWISSSPYELSVDRYENDPIRHVWPGSYKRLDVDLAWFAWQAALEKTDE